MQRYKVEIIIESESPKDARKAIETFGLKAFSVEKLESQRTLNQNSALHKWFELIEQEAANNGSTMDMLITKPNEVPITRSLLKDMFRLIGNTMYKRDSTAKLTREEINQVIMVFEKILAERLGIDMPFPSIESLIDNPPFQ